VAMAERGVVALVVIGRNEGERLVRCLSSVHGRAHAIVYVDSGSTDRSVQSAHDLGAAVVCLDMAVPFTAARARNAGWRRALEQVPEAAYIQFVDGDCEICPGWIEAAQAHLDAHPDVVAVCGQRRERYPQRSMYNRLCDLEWHMRPGPVRSFGGDVMVRAAPLRDVGGYREDLIAGEEPELCVRLRRAGWTIEAMADDMTLHDAAMTRFGQWWKRIRRSGYAFAQGAFLHGAAPERHKVRETRRAWLWGLLLPAAILLAAVAWSPWALWALLAYPAQVLRLYWSGQGGARDRALRAIFLTLGRFPEMLGQLQFLRDRLMGRQSRLMEYK
jgi:glycosyltransferase involved in cell wall biosynthesis